jgi:DNA-binding SARP family transcriptional activator
MTSSPQSRVPGLFLVTLGTPALLEHGSPIRLRKKDLALLVYLRLEGRHGHSRGALAGLLWGESPEENARHSLTQALGRLRARLGCGVLEVGHDRVGCRATLDCDAALLQTAAATDVDDGILQLAAGEFLAGFQAGVGAEAFEAWADGRRAHLRTVAVSALERLGAEAEERGAWERALAAAQRAVELDPASEPGHRRMMRAWNALGHRVRALQHYERLTEWLAAEFETGPEPETEELAEQMRGRPPRPAPDPAATAPRPFPPPTPPASPFPALTAAAEPSAPRPPAPAKTPLSILPVWTEPPRPAPRPVPVRKADAVCPHCDQPAPAPAVHWAWGGVAGVAVLLALLWTTGALMGGGWSIDPDPADRPPELAPRLASGAERVARLDDWLRTDGQWIYYRYGAYMPGACDHPTRAVGNWGPDGWSVGTAVHCIDEAWLALDVEHLGERHTIQPETTYCINFLYRTGNASHWGQHGARGAPGLDSIRVVAANGAYNIGFAIVRDGPGRRSVRLTNAYPAPPC